MNKDAIIRYLYLSVNRGIKLSKVDSVIWHEVKVQDVESMVNDLIEMISPSNEGDSKDDDRVPTFWSTVKNGVFPTDCRVLALNAANDFKLGRLMEFEDGQVACDNGDTSPVLRNVKFYIRLKDLLDLKVEK